LPRRHRVFAAVTRQAGYHLCQLVQCLMHGFSPSNLLSRSRSRRLRVAAAALALIAPAAGAQALADCVNETDSARRLACYDRLFRNADTTAGAAAPTASAAPAPSAVPPPSASGATQRPIEWPEGLLVSNFFNKTWELTPATKRGTFIVRTYLPNFVLPMHYSSSINGAPTSPTHTAAAALPPYRPVDAKLQISLRTKIAEGLLLPDADLWFAFTQRSFWQVWNPQQSSPFRSTDYQPEAVYVIPVPEKLGKLPGGWQWRMAQLGLAHQSNGQSDPLSRSWNRVYAAVAFDRGEFGLTVRANQRLHESLANDDNPDLTRYIGNTEITASWLPGLSTATMTWRTNPGSWRRGSLQMDWTYPVSTAQPAGLRWYAQLFTGYGETLLDYNHRQTSLGLGLTLFQF
jgi:phospholipase A1